MIPRSWPRASSVHWLALASAWLIVAGAASRVSAGDWPAWRGPTADGRSTETNLPVKWSATENVQWKTPLPEPGNSTPIIMGDDIFLTQSLNAGAKRGVMCLDRATGKQKWFTQLDAPADAPTHKTNPYGSQSPTADESAVYAFLDDAGLAAFDREGKILWRTELGKFEHIWGFGSSPVLYKDLVLIHAGPGTRAFVAAYDKKTGAQRWKVDAQTSSPEKFIGSWSSPRIIQHAGRDLLLISHPRKLVAYNPTDGVEIWTCSGLTDLVYTTPVFADGLTVAMSGYHGRAMGVSVDGQGDVTETHRRWITPEGEREQQRIGSGVIINGHLFQPNEPGLEVISLADGKSLWQKRLGRKLWSSLVHADGRLYVIDQSGATFVLAPNTQELEILSENPLNETTNASISVSSGHLYIRTHNHLWSIGP